MRLRAYLMFAVYLVVMSVAVAKAHATSSLTRHERNVISFFQHHPKLAATPAGARVLAKVLPDVVRALAEATPVWPAHHQLWLCIHSHEASNWFDRDSGGNGHYGGLQMHPGWGYGTSEYASDDSQLTQERAAEAGYASNGYSRTWLLGQWYHPDCLQYA